MPFRTGFFTTASLLLLQGLLALATHAAHVECLAGPDAMGASAPEVKLVTPFGVDFDRAGNLYTVELTGHRVLKMTPGGPLTLLAGTGEKGSGGDGGPAREAQFNGLHNLAVAANGDIYLSDTWNSRVRKIEAASGRVLTMAGTGEKGFSGDGGPATQAKTGNVYCVALNPQGTKLFLADLDNRRVRVVDLPTGVITTLAGNGKSGVPANGALAAEAPLVDPRALAANAEGQVYILERGGHALRLVNSAGQIRTVAGTGKKGATGDGGDALAATLNGPKHLCFDGAGNVVIADTDNHVIRQYSPATGKIERLVGSGRKGTAGLGGPPEQLEMNQPHGVYVHANGQLYIADSHNQRLLRIAP